MAERPESDARIRDVRDAIEASRRSTVTAIAIATVVILAALAYMWWTDPYARCKRLEPKITARDANPTSAEIDAWNSQECEEWPGI